MNPILKLLECLSDGDCHSGEEIATALCVSRTAIWKQIKKLNTILDDEILSISGKGYQWQTPFIVLNKEKIYTALSTSTQQELSHIDVMFECSSTNQILLENNDEYTNKNCLLLAEFQSQGRGRRGRSWVSPLGSNIYMSLSWAFKHSVAEMSGLSLVVAISIANAIKEHGIVGVKLKWPNDIYVNDKKLAGVLLELRGESNSPCRAVIGIGANVNMPAKLGHMIDQPWIDMQQILDGKVDRNKVAASIINELVANIKLFEEHKFSAFIKKWESFDLLKGKDVNVIGLSEAHNGIARGVDQEGALLVEFENKIQPIYSGEVSIRLNEINI